MIRPFEPKDLDDFSTNGNATIDDIMPVFQDDTYKKFTLVANGAPKAIICFRNNGRRDWAGFLVAAGTFTAREGVRVKLFLEEMVRKYKPVRFWTVSRRGSALDKWHKFLGMTEERDIVVGGRQCTIWSSRYGN